MSKCVDEWMRRGKRPVRKTKGAFLMGQADTFNSFNSAETIQRIRVP